MIKAGNMLAASVLLGVAPLSFAADASGRALRTITPADILHWCLALIVVLALFFAGVRLLRKLQGLPPGGMENFRVLTGLSLGVREKIVLLEVGNKQLLLGVTPGRIETLLVLDESDRLQPVAGKHSDGGAFAVKLKQALKERGDA
ncbi:MAG: flagellar biosynthetic protein FliO [Gammaproteobacteria bacterium]